MIKCDEQSIMTKQFARLCAMCCKKCMTQCAKHKTDKVCKACHVAMQEMSCGMQEMSCGMQEMSDSHGFNVN